MVKFKVNVSKSKTEKETLANISLHCNIASYIFNIAVVVVSNVPCR